MKAIRVDNPISTAKEDKLGYATHATKLARHMQQTDWSAGFTVALQGKWGCGKTSLANLIVEALPKDVVIVRFEAWWFASAHDVLNQLLGTIANRMELKKGKAGNVGKILKKFSGMLSVIKHAPVIGQYAETAEKCVEALSQYYSDSAPDVVRVREELSDALKNSNVRLCVVIDDLDRIGAENAYWLVSAMAAVTRLPQVCYLVTCDMDAVARLLEGRGMSDGREFLKRLIHLPFDIPSLNQFARMQAAHDLCMEVSDGLDAAHFKTRTDDNVANILAEAFDTMRDVKQLHNMITCSSVMIKKEVHFGDLMLLEIIRLKAPQVFESIIKHKSVLSPAPWEGLQLADPNHKKRQAILQEALKGLIDQVDRCPNPALVRRILVELFETFAELAGKNYGVVRNPFDARRIAAYDRFNVYIHRGVDAGAESIAKVDSWLRGKRKMNLAKYAKRILASVHGEFKWYSFISTINNLLASDNSGVIPSKLLIDCLPSAMRVLDEYDKGFFNAYDAAKRMLVVATMSLPNEGVKLLSERFAAGELPVRTMCEATEMLLSDHSISESESGNANVCGLIDCLREHVKNRIGEVRASKRFVYIVYALARILKQGSTPIIKELLNRDAEAVTFIGVHVNGGKDRFTSAIDDPLAPLGRDVLEWLKDRCAALTETMLSSDDKTAFQKLIERRLIRNGVESSSKMDVTD